MTRSMTRLFASLVLCVALLLPGQGWAAITADTSVKCSGTTSPITCSITVVAGSNLAMFVPVGIGDGTTTVSSITHNGVDIFGAAQFNVTNATVAMRVVGYCGIAPSTGTHDVVVTFNAAPSSGAWVAPSSWQGVDQTTPCRTATTAKDEAGNTAVSVTAANAQNGDVVVDAVVNYQSGLTIGAGQTLLQQNNALLGGTLDYASSYESATGSTAMTWTSGATGVWVTGAVPLVPASAGGPDMTSPYKRRFQ